MTGQFSITTIFISLAFLFAPPALGEKAEKTAEIYLPDQNIIAAPTTWKAFSDKMGTTVSPKNKFVNDGVLSLRYYLAEKNQAEWPWLQVEASLPFTLKDAVSIEIEYESDHPIAIALPQHEFIENKSFSHYRYMLPSAADLQTTRINFSAFTLPDWAPEESKGVRLNKEEINKIVISPIPEEDGGNGRLLIKSIYLQRDKAPLKTSVNTAIKGVYQEKIAKVFFNTNSSLVLREYRPAINEIANDLKAHNNLKVEITGYADTAGDPDYNTWLSMQRAAAVAKYLNEQGITSERMKVQGVGSEAAPSWGGGVAVKHERRVEVRAYDEQAGSLMEN